MVSVIHTPMDNDLDCFLEAVFMNENRCQDEGYQEGLLDGQQRGLKEGFDFGCQQGCSIGSELGFYLGYAETMREKAQELKNKDRVLKVLDSLVRLIESFPLTEPQNPQLHELVQAIRAKFKQET